MMLSKLMITVMFYRKCFQKMLPYVISMWSILMFLEWDWYMLYVFENVIHVYANSWNCLRESRNHMLTILFLSCRLDICSCHASLTKQLVCSPLTFSVSRYFPFAAQSLSSGGVYVGVVMEMLLYFKSTGCIW